MQNDLVASLVLEVQTGLTERVKMNAFGELTLMFRGLVKGVVSRRLGIHGEVDDLVQDVFLHAMRKIHQLNDPKTFGSWIRVIANHKAINHLRQRKLMSSLDLMEGSGPVIEDEAWKQYAQAETREQIREALQLLSQGDREILTSFYLKGRSIRKIGEAFGIPEGTVKSRLNNARNRLKAVIEHSKNELLVY